MAWRRRVLVPESRSRRRKICGGLRGDLWRCGHDTGRNGIRLEGGIQKDARDHHGPDRIIRGRTKRNDGRKLLEETDPSDFKDHHLFIPGIAFSPVTFAIDT